MKISDILVGNHEIRFTRKFEIRGILRPFSVPNNRVSRGPPVYGILRSFLIPINRVSRGPPVIFCPNWIDLQLIVHYYATLSTSPRLLQLFEMHSNVVAVARASIPILSDGTGGNKDEGNGKLYLIFNRRKGI